MALVVHERLEHVKDFGHLGEEKDTMTFLFKFLKKTAEDLRKIIEVQFNSDSVGPYLLLSAQNFTKLGVSNYIGTLRLGQAR